MRCSVDNVSKRSEGISNVKHDVKMLNVDVPLLTVKRCVKTLDGVSAHVPSHMSCLFILSHAVALSAIAPIVMASDLDPQANSFVPWVGTHEDELMFHPHEFRHWSVMVGGLDLDAFASPYNMQLPDYSSHYSSAFDESFDGRRVWAFPPVSLVRRCVRKILRSAKSNARTAGLLLVPVLPYASWWGLRKHFKVLTKYSPGECIFQSGMPDRLSSEVISSARPYELWWLPPGEYSSTVHTAQLRKGQRSRTSELIQSRRRVDLTVEDLRASPCGCIGPPLASNTRALYVIVRG